MVPASNPRAHHLDCRRPDTCRGRLGLHCCLLLLLCDSEHGQHISPGVQYRVTHLRGTSEVAAAGSNGKRALSLPRPAAVRGALVVKGPVCTGASLRHEYAGRRRDVEGGALVHHSSIRHGIEPRLSPLPPTQALSRLHERAVSLGGGNRPSCRLLPVE